MQESDLFWDVFLNSEAEREDPRSENNNKAAELEISAKTVLLTMSSSLAPLVSHAAHKSHIFILAKNQQLSNAMPMEK